MSDSLKNSNWVDNVILTWTLTGVKMEKGASLEMISEAQKITNFNFPQDFIDLYEKVNGFRDLDWNEHMFSFWSLDRIISEYQADDDQDFIGFCDFLINSYPIGFSKDTNQIFKYFDRKIPICDSFMEAVYLINAGSDKIY